MNAAREVPVSRTLRPFYWSVRRELWEHRSIYMAPIIVAAVALVGLIVASASLPSTTFFFRVLFESATAWNESPGW